MCGRFSLRVNRQQIRDLPGYHGVEIDQWEDEEEFVPRYNIAPRTQAPVIRQHEPGSTPSAHHNAALKLQTMKWGLVPHWSKFEDKSLNTMNARSENLIEGGGMWATIKGKKRCAIPCQGYYEWLTNGKVKIPHFLKRKDGNLLLMAGLYDSVVLEGRTLRTFTIVTTGANEEFSWLHDRQPVFLLTTSALRRWLDTSSQTWTPELTNMVQPYNDPSVFLDCYQVPKEVGKVGTESPSFIEPITNRKDGIEAMFAKQRQLQATDLPAGSPTNPLPSSKSRKRSLSPSSLMSKVKDDIVPDQIPRKRHKVGSGDSAHVDIMSPKLKSKAKVDSYLSPPPKSSQKHRHRTPPSSLKKSQSRSNASGNPKITSFFGTK